MQLSNWPRLALLGALTVAPLTACAPSVAPALARNAEPPGQPAADSATTAGSATAPTASPTRGRPARSTSSSPRRAVA